MLYLETNYWENLNPAYKKTIQRVVFIFPLLLSGVFSLIKILTNNSGIYWYFTAEDSLIEDASSLVYFLACFAALFTAFSLRKRGLKKYGNLMILLSLIFLFIAFEEISWGQRFLGIESPEFFKENNYQQEITLHNLGSDYILHACFIIMGFYGCFARKLLPKKFKLRFKTFYNLFMPPSLVFFYFFPVFAFYLYHDYISPLFVPLFGPAWGFNNGHFLVRKDQEFWEFLMGLGWLVFMTINVYAQKRPQETKERLYAKIH